MDNKERNEVILKLTCDLLEKMNFEVENAFVEDMEGEESQVLVGITVANPANLIGFRGRNLSAIQTVLSLMIKNKNNEWIRVLLDINNYRAEQKERLVGMVENLVKKVQSTGTPVVLAHMSSYERRICHMAIAETEGIVSESEGEGEDRHIVIKPKA
ncbi:MAG: R3H domain-containing nucleic acid-binding protein [Candidatus Shapirobacteria bacterium]|nr:R3H domain-containing nucleic acid-binding protein [Candidatus Shapirobacteria bacterium]